MNSEMNIIHFNDVKWYKKNTIPYLKMFFSEGWVKHQLQHESIKLTLRGEDHPIFCWKKWSFAVRIWAKQAKKDMKDIGW